MNKTLAVESADWFLNPRMMGHYWAKETVLTVKQLIKKYVSSPLQIELATFCLPLDSNDWHAWNNVTQKSLNILRYVLKRIDSNNAIELLWYVNEKQGCLKDELTWFLESKSYNESREEYYQSVYSVGFKLMGLGELDCRERFRKYHEEILSHHNIPA